VAAGAAYAGAVPYWYVGAAPYGRRAELDVRRVGDVEELGGHQVAAKVGLVDVDRLSRDGAREGDGITVGGEGRVDVLEARAEGRDDHVLDRE